MSMGAVLMILNLASDPFMQQIVVTQPKTVFQDEPSVRAPRATDYSLSLNDTPDFSMLSAIYAGLNAKDPSDILPLASFCPSGQCVWQNFTTLGVCSTCQDITSKIQKLTYNGLADASKHGPVDGQRGKSIVFGQTGSGPGLVTDPSLKMMNISIRTNVIGWPEKYNELDDWLEIATFYILNVTDPSSIRTWPNTAVSGSQCTLTFCLQEVEDSVSNGTAMEIYRQITAELASPMSKIPGPSSKIHFLDPSNRTDNYTVSGAPMQALGNYFAGAFLGGTFSQMFVNGDATGKLSEFPSGQTEAIYRSTDIDKLFKTLATAMSYSVRQNSNSKSEVLGISGYIENIVTVRWAWITVPMVDTIMGAVFLGITIRANRRAQIPLWREGQLPVLMHGFESSSLRSTTAKLTTCTAMEQEATNVNAALQRNSRNGMAMRVETGDTLSLTSGADTPVSRSSPWWRKSSLLPTDHEVPWRPHLKNLATETRRSVSIPSLYSPSAESALLVRGFPYGAEHRVNDTKDTLINEVAGSSGDIDLQHYEPGEGSSKMFSIRSSSLPEPWSTRHDQFE